MKRIILLLLAATLLFFGSCMSDKNGDAMIKPSGYGDTSNPLGADGKPIDFVNVNYIPEGFVSYDEIHNEFGNIIKIGFFEVAVYINSKYRSQAVFQTVISDSSFVVVNNEQVYFNKEKVREVYEGVLNNIPIDDGESLVTKVESIPEGFISQEELALKYGVHIEFSEGRIELYKTDVARFLTSSEVTNSYFVVRYSDEIYMKESSVLSVLEFKGLL